MRLWRIPQRAYALDRLCAGAALYGGRWNPVGLPALYCSTSIALTALEKLVHLGSSSSPALVLVAVDLPDNASIFDPGAATLPHGWDAIPTSNAAQAFGAVWLTQKTFLCMKVPSVIVPEESNVVVNPRHLDYRAVKLSVVRPFAFDRRIIK